MAEAHYRLVERQGPTPGRIFELTSDEVTIGRDITNDIVINDAEVSRKHARLTLEGERYKIEDLNSTNGTYIDGQRLIGPHVMAVGEVILFGDNVGMVFDGEPAKPEVVGEQTVDMGATPVAAIPAAEVPYPPPTPTPTPPESTPLPAEQAMREEQPEQPVEESRRLINSWLLAGCGCLLVIVILLIALWVFIDQPWNPGGGLYCVSPFDIIFKALGYCP
jgi:pSer/pThr/pTyr-binding forkhead associated (FHA) protein